MQLITLSEHTFLQQTSYHVDFYIQTAIAHGYSQSVEVLIMLLSETITLPF